MQISTNQNALFYTFTLVPTLFLLEEVVEKAVHYFAFALG